jgi:hypothetical protein
MHSRHSGWAIALSMIVAGCTAPAIRSQPNAYSYLGKVIERTDDVDLSPTQPHPLSRDWYLQMYGPAGAAMYEALERSKPTSRRTEYQRYTMVLEQGEKLSLRSKIGDINIGDCVRVWIRGPGVSPVYLYSADQAELEKAAGCK